MRVINSACVMPFLLASTALADDSFKTFIEEADAYVNLRHRIAVIEDERVDPTGTLSTLQTLVGVRTGRAFDVSGFIEFRNVTTVGTDRMNTVVNARTNFPIEPDPEATEVDQAYITYHGIPNTTVSFGRRKLNWGNKRFVASLAWRQNQQSYDGFHLESEPIKGLELDYTWTYNVNRVFTDDSPIGNFDSNTHLANAAYAIPGVGKLTGYGYWIDINDDFGLALSTRTFGANLTGEQALGSTGWKLSYVLEGAQQKDFADNPVDLSLGYYRVEPALKSNFGLTLKAGYEVLEGNGEIGFSTPLALLHAYNGFADQFLATPADGLEDAYLTAIYKTQGDGPLSGININVTYHDFQAEDSARDFGTEWNMVATKKIGRVNVLLKAALFNADDFPADVNKFWLMFNTRF